MPGPARTRSEFDFVSFEDPPVAEVALCFQFTPNVVDIDVLASFSERMRPTLPVRQLHPVAPPITERFDLPTVPTFEFRLDQMAALPRVWFISEDGIQLVQLQHDRLTLNWRELHTGAPYPRYDQLRERFSETLSLLRDCLEGLGRPSPGVTLAEITYVNHVDAFPGQPQDTTYADLADIINRLKHRPEGAFLSESEDVQLNARWRIPDGEGDTHAPVGRLYLSAAPGLKPMTNAPIYILNLIARVLPDGPDLERAWEALDKAHKWVVLGFADLTTDRMHETWGLTHRSTQ